LTLQFTLLFTEKTFLKKKKNDMLDRTEVCLRASRERHLCLVRQPLHGGG
jgi:hypothetical protein